MSDTIDLATASWSGFYDGSPTLNRENWGNYFSDMIPNGMMIPKMEGNLWVGSLTPFISDNDLYVDSGYLFYDNLAIKFESSTLITKPANDNYALVYVDVDTQNKTAKMKVLYIPYDQSALERQWEVLITNLYNNPNYIVGNPICIAGYSSNHWAIADLRRIFPSKKQERSYNIAMDGTGSSLSTSENYAYRNGLGNPKYIYPYIGQTFHVDLQDSSSTEFVVNLKTPLPLVSDMPIVVSIENNTNVTQTIVIRGNIAHTFAFLWTASWTVESNGAVSKALEANSSMTIILTPAYIDGQTTYWTITSPSTAGGSELDPEQIYTKAEVNQLVNGFALEDEVYSKTESDAKYATKQNLSDAVDSVVGEIADVQTDLDSKADATAVSTALAGKADANNVYSKTEADALLLQKASNSKVDTGLASKADANTTYTKTETDNLLASKANSNETYTKSQTDALLDQKPFKSQVYTKQEIDATIVPRDPVTIYCDADNGDDATGDGTENNPYKTLQKAIDMVPGNGLMNVVCPAFGVYTEDIIISGKDIFIKPASTRVVEIQGWVRVENSSNVTFDGTFKIEHDASCVWVSNHSNCYFKYNGDSYRPHFLYGNYSVTSGETYQTRNWALIADTGSQIIIPASVEITCHHEEYHAICARFGGTIYVNSVIMNTPPGGYIGAHTVFWAREGGMIFHGEVTGGDHVDIDEIEGTGVINPISKNNYYTKTETDSLISANNRNKNFYVDAWYGSDSTGKGTQSSPFASLQKAIDLCPTSGSHVIHYASGMYRSLEIVNKNIRFSPLHSTDVMTLISQNADGNHPLYNVEIENSVVYFEGNIVINSSCSAAFYVHGNSAMIAQEININGISEESSVWRGGFEIEENSSVSILSVNFSSSLIAGDNIGLDVKSASTVYVDSINFDFPNDATTLCMKSEGATIMYGSLTKGSGMTTSQKSKGGMIRTGSSN